MCRRSTDVREEFLSTERHTPWLVDGRNDLVDLRGLDNVMALEWLDVSSNNLESFSGFARSYRLTWVNAYNNNVCLCDVSIFL